MQIPQIRISQRPAKIGLEIKPPRLEIKQSPAEMEIKQPAGRLEINSKNIEIKVDNYPARFDLGIKNSVDFSRDIADKGQQAVMEVIARYASEGDRLMKIENKANTIEDIASNDALNKNIEIGLKWKRGPRYEVKSHQLEIKYQPQKPIIRFKANKPDLNFQWGDVKVRMEQYNDVKITVTGSLLDRIV